MNKQKHLNLEARILIETLLNERNSFKSIARHLGKDCTTISKEVKAHICFDKTGAYGHAFNDCRLAFLHQCSIQKICYHCTASNTRLCWTCGKCNSSYYNNICLTKFNSKNNWIYFYKLSNTSAKLSATLSYSQFPLLSLYPRYQLFGLSFVFIK